jgi:hypothetical protein
METYILNKKIINFSKNVEYTLQIPVSFNANTHYFKIETSDFDYRSSKLILTLKLSVGNEIVIKEIHINENFKSFNVLTDNNYNSGNFTLLACSCNATISVAISILNNNVDTTHY